jgi:polysaccharide biosynthesis/export protein ExoF
VPQPQQATVSPAYLGGERNPQPVGGRNPWRFARRPLVFLVLSFATIGGAVATVSPLGDLTGNVQNFSDVWKRLLVRPGEGSAAGHSGGMLVPRGATADIKHGEVLSYGDRLKITFFETGAVDLASDGTKPDHVVAVVFPRMDLSAEYTVDGISGRLDIPKLGQIAAAGKSITALQSELAAAFRRAVGRPSDVHVAVIDRLPIYVVGAVRAAGALKYSPGMFVMQALAAAGGADRGVSDTSKAIENIRETGRLRLAKSKLDRLQVKEARLLAQQANAETISIPASIASQLSQTGTRDSLRNIIDAARASLVAERKNYRDQVALADRQIEVVKLEVDAQKRRIDRLNEFLRKKTNKLQEVQEIARRGSVPHFRITDMEIEIGDLVTRREDYSVSLAQTERRLVEQEAARAKLERDHFAAIEAELNTVQQEIHGLNYEIASMQAVIATLQNGTAVAPGSGGNPRLSITRRAAGQFVVVPADEATPLLPGDVVKVDLSSPSIANAQRLAHFSN